MDKNLNARLPDGTMFDFLEKNHQRRRPMPAQAAGAVYGYLQGVENLKNIKLLLACNRRFPKDDRKALWSPPQRRNLFPATQKSLQK